MRILKRMIISRNTYINHIYGLVIISHKMFNLLELNRLRVNFWKTEYFSSNLFFQQYISNGCYVLKNI